MPANTAHNWRVCVGGINVVCLFVGLAASLMAQTDGTGALTGKVTDPTGAPVAFAMITTTSVETGQVQTAATGTDGTFKMSLPPGKYLAKFESPAYKVVAIPAVTIRVNETTVQDCKLEADAQTKTNATAAPAQKPASTPSDTPAAPSLEDLGITPAQAKGSAKDQALLDRRSHMLKVHQRLGLITIAPLVATFISSTGAGGRQGSSSGRDLHAALGVTTAGLYFTSASFAIWAPKIPGTPTRGPIRLHKTLAWIHAPGMILTPILGAITFEQKSRGEKVHGIATLQGPVAIATGAAFGLAVASVSFKF
jgi:hypothetical protein